MSAEKKREKKGSNKVSSQFFFLCSFFFLFSLNKTILLKDGELDRQLKWHWCHAHLYEVQTTNIEELRMENILWIIFSQVFVRLYVPMFFSLCCRHPFIWNCIVSKMPEEHSPQWNGSKATIIFMSKELTRKIWLKPTLWTMIAIQTGIPNKKNDDDLLN